MKTEREINVKMFRVEDDAAPLVMVSYMDKYAEEHSGLMLLDSCCNDNILTSGMLNHLGSLSQRKGEIVEFISIGDEIATANKFNFSFVLGSEQFCDIFCLDKDAQLPQIAGDVPIIGILGNEFMAQHELVIDYSNFTLHKSNFTQEHLQDEDFEYFFPMVGAKYYKLPVVAMMLNGRETVAIADSGATNNVIASQTTIDSHVDVQYLGTNDIINGYKSALKAEDAIMPFGLVSIGDGEMTKEFHHKDLFKVVPSYIFSKDEDDCDENGYQLPPVEAIIGSPFMAKESWILDFGVGVIYKKGHTVNPQLSDEADVIIYNES